MSRTLGITWVRSICLGVAVLTAAAASAVELPKGYMAEDESGAILAKTLRIHLDPDLSGLSDAEQEVVRRLIDVGNIFQNLHEFMRHHQSVVAYRDLLQLDERLGSPAATQNLITMYYMAKGPIIRSLDSERKPFLPVDNRVPGRNVYPWGVAKEDIEAFIERYPEARSWLLGVRNVVRASERDIVKNDLATLIDHPVLDVMHPGLKDMLADLRDDPGDKAFYALPYSVAFAEPLLQAYRLLMEAAEIIEPEDPEFAGYLGNRARDLLSDDYESGDAAWVTGKFGNLNAQIGAYEVYDDQLYGVKAFFGLNVLLRDKEQSDALREAIKGMQAFENALPYEPEGYTGGNKKSVREDIPVGVYNIIADFGQSRGTNTATILPNESEHARKYGRTILLRYNIMDNPELFEIRRTTFGAAVREEFAGDLKREGGFYRTLWHEIGHYLGVDRTRDGRDLGEALERSSSVYEELKADLVSLFLARKLEETGYYTPARRSAVYASGIRRVLLKNKPTRAQPYQTMELMQMNYYLEHGLLEFDKRAGRLVIHYDRYHEIVEKMLGDVLFIQYNGDMAEADAFIDKYTTWAPDLHEMLAESMKSSEKYRYAYVTYGALAEPAALSQ